MKKILKFSILLSLLMFLVMPISVGAQGCQGVGCPTFEDVEDTEFNASSDIIAPPPSNPTDIPSLKSRLSSVAGEAGFNTNPTAASTPRVVGIIVGAFINFTGLTFIVLMIIAGYGWMTSNGSEEKIKKSVSTIKASIIGLIVSLSAWAIWNLIFERLIIGG